MKDFIIKLNDALFTFAFIIYALIGLLFGYAMYGGVGAFFGLIFGAFLGAMASGFWFVLSGIYHNTKHHKL